MGGGATVASERVRLVVLDPAHHLPLQWGRGQRMCDVQKPKNYDVQKPTSFDVQLLRRERDRIRKPGVSWSYYCAGIGCGLLLLLWQKIELFSWSFQFFLHRFLPCIIISTTSKICKHMYGENNIHEIF